MGDTLHQTAIADKGVGTVIDNLKVLIIQGSIKMCRQQLFCNGQPDGIRQALTQRPRGGFHPWCVAKFWMPRRSRTQLPKFFKLGHGQIVAGQVQQGIDQHGAMTVRQHKTIAVRPLRIGWIVPQKASPERLSDIRHTEGCAWVPGFGLLDGVHRQRAYGIGSLSR